MAHEHAKTELQFGKAATPGHALIIEDDALIAASIEDELRQLQFTSFDVARSEGQALMMASAQAPSFITVDAKLEEGNGLDAVLKICSSQAVPVILVTGDPFSVDLPGVVTLGKPFSSAAFRVAYEQAMAKPFRAGEFSVA